MAFFGFHGVMTEEKTLGQKFFVDCILTLDLDKAGQTDDVNETVSYADVYETIKEILEGPSLDLIEAVAKQIVDQILLKYPKVQEVSVEVKKPEAPVRGQFDYFSVCMDGMR